MGWRPSAAAIKCEEHFKCQAMEMNIVKFLEKEEKVATLNKTRRQTFNSVCDCKTVQGQYMTCENYVFENMCSILIWWQSRITKRKKNWRVPVTMVLHHLLTTGCECVWTEGGKIAAAMKANGSFPLFRNPLYSAGHRSGRLTDHLSTSLQGHTGVTHADCGLVLYYQNKHNVFS